ncbi:MAG TPA: ASKHA domain-containing protein [Bacillota bacterium]|nr:ASKHA domain-containing protein [Bacillota bacterium]
MITFEPGGRRVMARPGDTVLEVARSAGILLASACGGRGSCGNCRVLASPAGPVAPEDEQSIGPAELALGYRLACRLRAGERDLTVFIPVASAELELQLDAGDDLPAPIVPPDFSGARAAPVDPDGPPAAPVGLAIDLGTTKIAVYLVDLRDGRSLAAAAVANPQASFGHDVMSRLDHALRAPGGGTALRETAREGIGAAVRLACAGAGVRPDHLLAVSLVGNAAMHHLFLGLPVARLAAAPFLPAFGGPLELTARELGLEAAPGACCYLPPLIGGHIGSDHLAAMGALQLWRRPGHQVLVDVGTNTEVSLSTPAGRIFSCSCASGPAFEGARIRHGMRAAPGAVDRVRIDPATGLARVGTVAGRAPAGICGTGILEAVAELRLAGLLTPSGGFRDGPGVRRGPDGRREYLLARGGDGDITVTQKDVQEVLLAKGAIRAGIDLMLSHAGASPGDVDAFWIAGAFGTHLDARVAVRVGMFPDISANRFRAVGNAAGAGAREVLASSASRGAFEALAARIECVELGSDRDFAACFARALRLP